MIHRRLFSGRADRSKAKDKNIRLRDSLFCDNGPGETRMLEVEGKGVKESDDTDHLTNDMRS